MKIKRLTDEVLRQSYNGSSQRFCFFFFFIVLLVYLPLLSCRRSAQLIKNLKSSLLIIPQHLSATLQSYFMSQSLSARNTLEVTNHYQWEPGVIRRAPWTAVIALVVVLFSAIINIVIVVVSDGQKAPWRIYPSVIVSFFNSLSTTLLAASLSIGVTIYWWRAVSDNNGATLKELHNIWNYGPSGSKIASVFAAVEQSHRIAIIASLMTLASIAYNPLMNRSTTLEYKNIDSSVERYLATVDEFTNDYLGNNTANGAWEISGSFAKQVQYYITEDISEYPTTFAEPYYSCQDTCTGSISSVRISHTSGPLYYTTVNLSYAQQSATMVVIFSTSFSESTMNDSIPVIEMTIKYIGGVDGNCVATIYTTTYAIQVASVHYPVQINNVTIGWNKNGTYDIDSNVTYPGDALNAAVGTAVGPLKALLWVAESYLQSNTVAFYDNTAREVSILSPCSSCLTTSSHSLRACFFPRMLFTSVHPREPSANLLQWTMIMNGTLSLQWLNRDYSGDGCPYAGTAYRYIDPSTAIVGIFENVLFWAAIDAAGKTNTIPRAYRMNLVTETLVYASIYGFLVAATLILMIAFVVVSSTLWGWWELGRTVSLNPLETAKAFGASLFQAESFDMDAEHLAANTGELKVRYKDQAALDQDGHKIRVLRIIPVGNSGAGNNSVEMGTVIGEYV
jgi:hypothetical protein